jgi:hypothetical protein
VKRYAIGVGSSHDAIRDDGGLLRDGSIVRPMSDFVNALSLMALVAATLEYAIVMRHREERRDAIRWQVEVRESLVSSGNADAAPRRRWTDDGTRFRVEP